MYSRLPLDTIRISEIFQVSDQVKEDSDFTKPEFEKVKDQIRKLKEGNVHLTYQLMGSLDSHSEAIEGSSQAQAQGEIRLDKGKSAPKRNDVHRKCNKKFIMKPSRKSIKKFIRKFNKACNRKNLCKREKG